jgi:hypothetical protein
MRTKRSRRHGGATVESEMHGPYGCDAEGGWSVSGRELDDLLLHIKGLVLVREILKQRGASPPSWRPTRQSSSG